MNKLDCRQYQATFEAPMLDVTMAADPVMDIWPYVDAVPINDLEGFILTDGLVKYVYQHPKATFLHVLVATENTDIFLVLIIDLALMKIYGHYLLNLLQLYEIAADSEE